MTTQATSALGYRVSYDGSHWRVMRRRGDVDERRLAATFPDVQAAQRAVDRLYYSHGLETPVEERRVGEEEAYWRSIALAGEWDDESVPL